MMDSNRPQYDLEQCISSVNLSSTGPALTERTALLHKNIISNQCDPSNQLETQQEIENYHNISLDFRESIQKLISRFTSSGYHRARLLRNPKFWDSRVLWKNIILPPVEVLPAVALGLLLNVLDALSYGMYFILHFHINETRLEFKN